MDKRPTNEMYVTIDGEEIQYKNYEVVFAKSPSGKFLAKAKANQNIRPKRAIINEYGDSLEEVKANILLLIDG